MTPRLLNSNADNFTRLGYGPLNNCISCTVTEELGEAPTLELEVLITDPLLPFIQVGNIISAAPNKRDEPQAFVIEEISKPLDGIITVYAPHIAQHRGKLIPVRPTYAGTLDNSLNNIIASVMETNPFTIKRDPSKENVSASWEITAPRSLRECLGGREGSIVDVFGGEWKYDNYTLTLYNHIGRDNGVRVLYGRNMTDFELEEEFNWTFSVTGCVGFWTGENDSGTETTVYGNVIHSDLAGNYPYNKTVVVDFSGNWDTPPSVATIDQAASEWIRGKGQIGATAKVAFNHLEVENGGDVGLGDTIHVYNNEYGYDMESRIVGTEYDVLQEEYLSVTIGDKQTTLTEAIQGTVDVDTSASGGGSGPSVEPSYTMPLMDGTAAIGTETKYARGDHRHPTDTSRVAKAGDTMTGALIIKSPSFDLSGNPPASGNAYALPISWYDKNGTYLASARPLRTAGDVLAYRDGIQREVNGATYYNFLLLGVDETGKRSITVSAAPPWRHAIGPAVGDVICTYSNTNPSANYEGTWELIDKEFTPTTETNRSSSVSRNTTNCDAILVYTVHNGHQIQFWVQVKNKVAIANSTLTMATFTPANFGVSDFGDSHRLTEYSDAGDALIMWYLAKNGTFQTFDGWTLGTSLTHSVPAQQLDYINFNITLPMGSMLDSWCNKFYWRRKT